MKKVHFEGGPFDSKTATLEGSSIRIAFLNKETSRVEYAIYKETDSVKFYGSVEGYEKVKVFEFVGSET